MEKDLNKRIIELENEVAQLKLILKGFTVPVIESALPNTLLVPITGYMLKERSDMIDATIFETIQKNRNIKNIVIDFTAMNLNSFRYVPIEASSIRVQQLNSTLKLFGIRPIYCGFQPEVVHAFVSAGFTEPLEAYATYRQAIDEIIKTSNIDVPNEFKRDAFD